MRRDRTVPLLVFAMNSEVGLFAKYATLDAAREGALFGAWAAWIVAIVICMFVLASVGLPESQFTQQPVALFRACLFAVLGFGIMRMSRLSAIVAPAVFFYGVVASDSGKYSWISILLFIFFSNGIWATFRYRHLLRRVDTPSAPAA